MISVILLCSFALYWLGIVAAGGLFLWSHSRYAPVGGGMPKEILFAVLTILVSALTGMAGLISTKIFVEDNKNAERNTNTNSNGVNP